MYIRSIYFELRIKDQIEERSSQLVPNLSSCEEAAIFYLIFDPPGHPDKRHRAAFKPLWVNTRKDKRS